MLMGKTLFDQTRLARWIADTVHEDQLDYFGYLRREHVERVFANTVGLDNPVGLDKPVALLHDVLNCTQVTAGELAFAGVAPEIIKSVVTCTPLDHEGYYQFVGRVMISNDMTARSVTRLCFKDRLSTAIDRNGVQARYLSDALWRLNVGDDVHWMEVDLGLTFTHLTHASEPHQVVGA